ncbi:MAG: peptidylprolyl isomerase [Pirellulales bacterium]
MKTAALFLSYLLFAIASFAEPAAIALSATNPYDLPDGLYSEITTPKGVIICELYYKKTPMTVANYVGLVEGTLGPEPRVPYYNGSPYHRIVPGYVLQGGGPPAERRGRLGYQFPDEFVPGLRHDAVGVMQMANGGPGTNGSQHCLMLGPAQRLNYLHTVFGRTVRGIEVLPKVEVNDTMQVKILRIGKDAQAFKADEEAFKALVARAKTNPGPHEPTAETHFHDPDGLLPTNPQRALHFNMKLSNFQVFTGQRIIARMFAKTPPEAAGGNMGKYLNALAEQMGVASAGALAVYTADDDQWHVRIGPESAASFSAGPRKPDGTKPPVAPGKTLDQATQEFLASVKDQAAKLIETAGQAPNDAVAPNQKLKLHVDALLDDLIFRLEPAAPAT